MSIITRIYYIYKWMGEVERDTYVKENEIYGGVEREKVNVREIKGKSMILVYMKTIKM